MRRLLMIAVSMSLVACASARPKTVEVTAAGSTVQAGKADPGAEYVELGPITVAHGGGCGRDTIRGTYEGAYAMLRNAAARMGGDYVRIDVANPSHYVENCRSASYALSGVVFEFVDRRPPAVPSAARAPSRTTGTERTPCDPNNTCNDGLTCASGLCVRLPSP